MIGIFLLDTNVISEMIKKTPDPTVMDWLYRVESDHVRISVLTLAEINRGILRLDDGKKKNDLLLWFDTFTAQFKDKTVAVDDRVAVSWGALAAMAERNGRTLHPADTLIAATAYVHGAILVTRNTSDFTHLPIQVMNPWL